MKKPRKITKSRVLLILSILIILYVTNIIYQLIWGIIYQIMDMFRGGFGDSGYFASFQFQFLLPVIVGLVVIGLYVLLAYSPIGIGVTKSMLGIRPIMTEEEKMLYNPLHDEVFQSVKEKFPNAVKKKLYILDSPDINAFCMSYGFDIAIHRGTVQTFNSEEVKAVIAHEYAHSYYKDGIFSAILSGTEYALIVMAFFPFLSNFKAFYSIMGTGNIFAWAFAVILIYLVYKGYMLLVKIVMAPLIIALNIISKITKGKLGNVIAKFIGFGQLFYIQNVSFLLMSKQQEYRADEFASFVGYHDGMLSVLQYFYEIDYQPLYGVMNKIFASHPSSPERIANLEKE